MILQNIIFGIVLAIVPGIGFLAIWYSEKQRRRESQEPAKHRHAGC
jgi:hypothetical protein